MKKLLVLLLSLCAPAALFAQQPQTQTAPIYDVNAKYANGVAPGYWATPGSGLTLNLSAGTVDCGGNIVIYSAGTLSMTASTTNNVYLDTSSSCAPAVKTGAFTTADIPIAQVVTSGSAITSVSDVRTPFVYGASGGSGTPGGANGNLQYNCSGSFCGDSDTSDDGAGNVVVTSLTTTGGANQFNAPELTDPTGIASYGQIWFSSANARWKINNNNTGALSLVGTPHSTAGDCPQYASNGYDLVDSGSTNCGGGSGGGGYTNVTGSISQTTVSAINSACGSGTYYATTPLSIATGGTVSCPVQFSKSGLWTIASGQTINFIWPITETDGHAQHFAGSGTVVLDGTQANAHPEWWGAVNDWNGSTGTDNTAAIQASITALPQGTVWLASGPCYKTTSALSITESGLGIQGQQLGGYVTPYNITSTTTPSSCIVSTSATADILDVAGTSSAHITWNVFKNFAVQRTVAPTGTAAGMNFQYTLGVTVDNTVSCDSIYNYYLKGTSSGANGGFFHSLGCHGYSGFTYSGGPYYDWYLDTSGGTNMNTVVLNWDGGADNGIGNSVCAALYGNLNVDENVLNLNCRGQSFGVDINTTSGGTTQDVHIDNPTLDTITTSAIRITESGGVQGPVTLSGGDGWLNTSSSSVYGLDCESASNITITGLQFFKAGQSGSGATAIYANGSSGLTISNNLFYPNNPANGVWFNNTNHSTIQGNVVNAGGGTGFVFHGSSGNMFQGNTVHGTLGVGASFDSTSNNNTGWQLDDLSAAITPVSDSGTGNTLPAGSPTGSAGGDLGGTYPNPTVQKLDSVPFCTGYAPANGDIIVYTTASTPNPCYTAQTAPSGSFTAGGDLSGTSSSQEVVGIHSVPLCTGFTPTNGQVLEYTTGGSPNPCYTAATGSGSSGALVNLFTLGSPPTVSGCTITGGECVATTASSITISSIPSGYLNLRIDVTGTSSGSSATGVSIQLNGDTTSGDYICTQIVNTTNSTCTPTSAGINGVGINGTNASFGGGFITIQDYTNSLQKNIFASSQNKGASTINVINTYGSWTATPAAVISITLTPQAGTFTGRIQLHATQ